MNPNQTLLSVTIISTFFLSSCFESSFLQSPLQGNTAAYHAMPVASDSIKSVTCINGGFSAGGMNDLWRDAVYSMQAGLHRSHVLNHFRAGYGAALALGTYHVSPYDTYTGNFPNNSVYTDAGSKFFGAYGLHGNISAATPMGRRGEWRYIGLEGNLFNEFGEYYTFRKNLPDSLATEIDRHKYIGSLGLATELVFKGRSQNKFGIKIAAGSYLRRLSYHDDYSGQGNYYYYHTHDDLLYFSNTYHITFKRTTAYFQFNIATHAAHFQVGYNYRL